MDLIDTSNAPTIPTVDPITGNPIVANTPQDQDVDINTSEDTSGSTAEPLSDSSTYITDTTRTVYPFESLSRDQKSLVVRLQSEIAHAWDIISPAAVIPYEFHPDPDTHNWGSAVLMSLSTLAQMTKAKKSLQAQAIQHVLDHIQERNDGLSTLKGDRVLRVKDVQYGIRKMRPATGDSYRPPRHGGRGRGRGRPDVRGRGRGRGQ